MQKKIGNSKGMNQNTMKFHVLYHVEKDKTKLGQLINFPKLSIAKLFNFVFKTFLKMSLIIKNMYSSGGSGKRGLIWEKYEIILEGV